MFLFAQLNQRKRVGERKVCGFLKKKLKTQGLIKEVFNSAWKKGGRLKVLWNCRKLETLTEKKTSYSAKTKRGESLVMYSLETVEKGRSRLQTLTNSSFKTGPNVACPLFVLLCCEWLRLRIENGYEESQLWSSIEELDQRKFQTTFRVIALPLRFLSCGENIHLRWVGLKVFFKFYYINVECILVL